MFVNTYVCKINEIKAAPFRPSNLKDIEFIYYVSHNFLT
jgi:hypothetical protein